MNSTGLKKVSLVTVSNLIANGVIFIILMVAAKTLPVSSFANFSLAVSLGFMLTTLLDFGVNVTSIRTYAMHKDRVVLDGMMTGKWMTLGIAAPLCGASLYFSPSADSYWSITANGFLGAAVMNLWMGCRTLEQADESFVSYARNNVLYAAIRLVMGGGVLWSFKDAQYLYVASFVLPGLLFAIAQGVLGSGYRLSLSGLRLTITHARTYSVWVFVSSIAYGAILYSPQFFVAQRFTALEVSSYGVALSFMAVVTLVANSVRTVLLPRMMKNNVDDAITSIKALLKKLIKFLPFFLFASVVVLLTGWMLINFWYAKTLPEAALVFVICSAGLLGTVYVGLFNMAIHSLGMPGMEAANNIGRLLFLLIALFALGDSLLLVATIFSIVLLAGELWTATKVMLRINSNG